jgi:hypothetical protein
MFSLSSITSVRICSILKTVGWTPSWSGAVGLLFAMGNPKGQAPEASPVMFTDDSGQLRMLG